MSESFTTRLHIQLLGSLRLTTEEGEQLHVSGAKDRALLALLCLSRDRRKPRALLQDKLWSDRGPDQGGASLRQALTHLRKVLNKTAPPILLSDNSSVSLDPDLISVDVDDLPAALVDFQNLAEVPELLEDLHNIDPEFDDWVRDQRLAWHDKVIDCLSNRPASSVVKPRDRAAQVLVEVQGGDTNGSISQHYTVDTILTSLSDTAGFRLLSPTAEREQEHEPSPVFKLVTQIWSDGDLRGHCLRLIDPQSGQRLWLSTRIESQTADIIDLHQEVNLCVDALLGEMRNHFAGDPENVEAGLGTLVAADRIFRNRGTDSEQVRKLLTHSHDLSTSGIQLAWKAFLCTYLVGERLTADAQGACDEAEALARQALEISPSNSMVLALASYVYSFLRHDFFTGYELARRATRLNPANPLAWAFLGCANVYLGRSNEGYEHCKYGRQVSGSGPYRYLVETLCFVAAAAAGKFDEALALAESTRRQTEGYAPPLRYLLALYRHLNHEERVEEVTRLLKQIEPDFTPEIMREQAYPMRALRDSGLLKL